MMKRLFATALLTALAAAGSHAQTTLPTTPQPPAPAAVSGQAGPDSVAAVRNLFRKRRNGGTLFTAIGSLVLVRGVLADGGGSVVGSALVAAPFLGVGVSKLVRFGSKREEAYIKQYQQGRPLPHHIRRRLRADYFRPTP
ncbi:hypothetical protein [Hymenobacter sp. B81]|uniref:hypothetical protein n=1 Tax=Hymenobacter sp. B81 TaxID=3344878 RepID=UPI0037DD2786